MRFFNQSHQHSCGIDLHTRTMYLCILDPRGEVVLHRNLPCDRDRFLRAVRPFRKGLVVAAECMFTWYWLADLCADEDIDFVLGHALYMKAIHGGKAKNDRIDAYKIAKLLRGGTFPLAYVYPRKMRATRDLMRRRTRCVRHRASLLAHIQNTRSQYRLPAPAKKLRYPANRDGIVDDVQDQVVELNIEADLWHADILDGLIHHLEGQIVRHAKRHDPHAFHRLRTVPGIGKVLALTILYEICDIKRFPRVQDFASYARLVRCPKESAGKRCGTSGAKIGNAHLKWAFSEAAVLFIRCTDEGKRLLARLEKKHGKGKAMSMLAHRLGRAVYFMLKRQEAFDMNLFMNT